jgi:hypothetical protein
MSLQHVVLFRFPEPLDDVRAREMRALVEEWPGRIGEFERLRFGTDLSDGERARGYQFLLLTEHKDTASLAAYQQHPVHLAFGEWVYSRGGEVIAFDYELGPETVFIS